jgi:hypothetical protein
MGAELILVDEQTDGHTNRTNPTVAFRKSAKGP